MLPLRSLGASDPLPHATTAAASGLPDSDSPGSCGLDVARADFEIGVDGAAADERQRQERGARAIPPLRLLFRGTLAALQQPHVFYVAVRGCSSAARVAHFNEHACQLPFHRPSVKSLGDFEIFHFAPDARSSSRATLPVPPAWLQPFVADVAALVPAVHFNLGWVQRYVAGDFVSEHHDPATLAGVTAICVFGEFSGARSYIEHSELQLEPGDVLLLRVNVGDRSCAMPLHSVAHVTSGVRYALILSEDMYASAAS